MGYACPVCDIPQQDGEHLANHLAFTALLHGNDHETWLDAIIPEWETTSPAELARTVTRRAEETDFPAVFEDTTDHDYSRRDAVGHPASLADSVDAETREIIDAARALTKDAHSNAPDQDDTSP